MPRSLTHRGIRERANKIGFERIFDAAMADDNLGFCLGCLEDSFGHEPDAEFQHCECCGSNMVFGAEQLTFYVGAF